MNSYEIAGKKLTCLHCQGNTFERSSSLSEVAGMLIPKASERACTLDIFVCSSCGNIQIFDYKRAVAGEIINCLQCGDELPPNVNTCPKCKWTYSEES